MNPLNIFDLHYLFELNVDSYMQYFWIWIAFFGAFVLGGVGVMIYTKMLKADNVMKKTLRGLPAKLIMYGLGGYFFIACRTNSAPILAMRIWFLLYLILLLILAYFDIKSRRKDYAERMKRKEHRGVSKKNDKYLPKGKKQVRK